MIEWTEERIDTLKKLVFEKLSYREIAEHFGTTRSAISGKTHRLGLAKPMPKTVRLIRARKPEKETIAPPARPVIPERRNIFVPIIPPSKPLIEKPVSAVVIPKSRRVRLGELRERMCHWPMGDPADPDFRFCGADKPLGSPLPYCEHHARIAYRPAPVKKRVMSKESNDKRRAAMLKAKSHAFQRHA